MSPRTRLCLMTSLFCLPAAGMICAYAAGFAAQNPFPTGTLRIARPQIAWKIWPTGGSRITGASLLLDGQAVPAAYSTEERGVFYTPEQPLAAGVHKAKGRVVFDDGEAEEQEWEFTIAEGALREIPPPDGQQTATLEAVNAYRSRMGLRPYRLDPRLCASATAHAQYLKQHGARGHLEEPGRPGFTGRTSRERMAAFGYRAPWTSEDVVQGDVTPDEVIASLFDPPYHRVPFMAPGTPDLGACFVRLDGGRGLGAVNFGADMSAREPQVVIYPVDGQRDVPLQFTGSEAPDVLRLHGGSYPVGYVITFLYFAPEDPGIRVRGATLTTDSGTPVPFFLNTPENDPDLEGRAAFIVPKQPLRPETTYQVSVDASTQAGGDLSRRWSFTTERKGGEPARRKKRRSR